MKPSSADELAQRLEQLELVQASQLDPVWTELGGRNVPVEDFGRALVRHELLTGYQIERLLKGEVDGLYYGRARVLYQVGAGSFSRVYRAIHADSGRILAVKVLRRRFSSDPEKCEAFQREGEMGRLLRHPNIVAIEDVGREYNTSYITMEFVEGQTLRELVRVRGAVDVGRALALILDVTRGLEYAHRMGVTHRDIKASNVLVAFSGEAKLVDFGLAGAEASGGKVGKRKGQPRTIDYATLEAIGKVKDDSVRSDIYFLGTVAYVALCGVPALKESRDRAVRADPRRFTDVEPLAWRAPELPRDVVDWVSRMMHLNPEERWQTAMDVRRNLEPLVARYAAGAQGKSGEAAAHPAKAASRERASTAPASGPSGKGTLMVAMAASDEQAALRDGLRKLGYKVLLTENLQRAIDRCSSAPGTADCLLISGSSFGDDAVEAFNGLAEDSFLRGIPAVLLVDPSQPEMAEAARQDAVRKAVPLPPEPADLAKVIDGLLAKG